MFEYKVDRDLATFEDCNGFFSDIVELLNEHDEVKVNFDDVKFMSSTGAGRLLSIQKKIQDTEKKVYLVNLRKEILNILKELGVIELTENIVYEN